MASDMSDGATDCFEHAGQQTPAAFAPVAQQTTRKAVTLEKIPEDAAHWDSGDWIEWHRLSSGGSMTEPHSVGAEPTAQLAALHVNLLRAAKSYTALTGEHLPVYEQIASIYAAIYCDLPLEGPDRTCTETGVEVLCLGPDAPNTVVEVDMTRKFQTLIVVRIKDDFTAEARMIQRAALPHDCDGPFSIRWHALPFRM